MVLSLVLIVLSVVLDCDVLEVVLSVVLGCDVLIVVLSVVLACEVLDVLTSAQGLETLNPPTALELSRRDSDSGDWCHE